MPKRDLLRPRYEILLSCSELKQDWQWVAYSRGRAMGSSRGLLLYDSPEAALQACVSEWPCTDPTQHLK